MMGNKRLGCVCWKQEWVLVDADGQIGKDDNWAPMNFDENVKNTMKKEHIEVRMREILFLEPRQRSCWSEFFSTKRKIWI